MNIKILRDYKLLNPRIAGYPNSDNISQRQAHELSMVKTQACRNFKHKRRVYTQHSHNLTSVKYSAKVFTQN
jgi:hypothetical protein